MNPSDPLHGMEVRYDALADSLTVIRPWEATHTATAVAHDSVVTLLRAADGTITGVMLHEATAMMPSDWIAAASTHRVPNDLYLAILEWLRRYSLARAVT